jgi:bifunctional UDP-N-acetylglucosamine pyrophosphorylase/glucosamine-1-phosphate N-acetyltransferase
VGDGAIIASGSTITENVPPKALAIGRSRQANKENYALKLKPEET